MMCRVPIDAVCMVIGIPSKISVMDRLPNWPVYKSVNPLVNGSNNALFDLLHALVRFVSGPERFATGLTHSDNTRRGLGLT